MSGGHFDHQQCRLEDMASEIDELIAGNDLEDGDHYPDDIIERFRETARTLRKASAMVQRVDCLVSGDNAEDSFRRLWREKVEVPFVEF